MVRLIASALIALFIVFPSIAVSIPVVALLLLTKWDGRSTIFGNAKHGRATNHFAFPTRGKYWAEFSWLALRNPVNNLMCLTLGVTPQPYRLLGDPGVGDKTRRGSYWIEAGPFWEYYAIKPWRLGKGYKCWRIRIGWKIHGAEGKAAFVFVINPFKTYLGV